MIRRTFPLVVGICGRAGAGKDTVAAILTKALLAHNGGRHRVVRRGLADPVKEVCRAVFGFTDLQLFGPSEERNKPDLRWARTWPDHHWQPGHRMDAGKICGRCGVQASTMSGLPAGPCVIAGTPRRALQLCGTEFGRAFHPDTWVRKLLSDLEGFGARTIVLVPDVRFDNEAAALRAKGGFMIEVRRPGENTAAVSGHASEAGVTAALIDHTVENDGTIRGLEAKLGAELFPLVFERLEEHQRKEFTK